MSVYSSMYKNPDQQTLVGIFICGEKNQSIQIGIHRLDAPIIVVN
jgi:hypothetical protein